MSLWKLFLSVLVLLLPGGSLVLLAFAAAKAWSAGRDRARLQPALVEAPSAVAAARG